MSSYITTNVVSITDGQLYLSLSRFLVGVKPAIDLGFSVSRVGSVAQSIGIKVVSGSMKLELAQFVELDAFSQFVHDVGAETLVALESGSKLVVLVCQDVGSPLTLASIVFVLSLHTQHMVSQCPSSQHVSNLVAQLNELPKWIALFIPVRLLGISLLTSTSN